MLTRRGCAISAVVRKATSAVATASGSDGNLSVPEGVQAHFSARPVAGRDRKTVHGIPVTGIERTLTDVLRSTGWTEQTSEAITRAFARGQTTANRLTDALPVTWHGRIRVK